MTTPRFSILIPTRDRAAYLRHTLATVASQPGEDYEIVVADNAGGPETAEIVKALDFPRLRYRRSDEILPMAENWERGLELCTGEYVTVLGDDDGLLPSTLEMARNIIAATEPELISWVAHTYWWPDTIVHWSRNILIVQLDSGAMTMNSRAVLEGFYSGELKFGNLPMIYNAFFHRGVIEEAQRRYDGFFVPRDTSPDVTSGIVGLHLTHEFVQSLRPLSVRGNSGKSNGTAHWMRSLGKERREAYYREERVGMKGLVHPALIPSPNMSIMMASAKLKCRELYFPEDPALTVDTGAIISEMISMLNFEPEAYEENLADIHALAAKLGTRVDPASIPPKREAVRNPAWGLYCKADGTPDVLNINCTIAGVNDVAAAARLIDAVLPPAHTHLLLRRAPAAQPPRPSGDTPLPGRE